MEYQSPSIGFTVLRLYISSSPSSPQHGENCARHFLKGLECIYYTRPSLKCLQSNDPRAHWATTDQWSMLTLPQCAIVFFLLARSYVTQERVPFSSPHPSVGHPSLPFSPSLYLSFLFCFISHFSFIAFVHSLPHRNRPPADRWSTFFSVVVVSQVPYGRFILRSNS